MFQSFKESLVTEDLHGPEFQSLNMELNVELNMERMELMELFQSVHESLVTKSFSTLQN